MTEEVKRTEFNVCKFHLVTMPDGKKHLESECATRASALELQDLLQEEVIIRVKPAAGVIHEDEPAPDPVT